MNIVNPYWASGGFELLVKSDNTGTSATDQFTIPISGAVNYAVTTSDGYSATGLTGAHTITFPSGIGTHTVTIKGAFPYIFFNNGGDRLKLLQIKKFDFYSTGTTQSSSFYGCTNLTITATDLGDFSLVANFTQTWLQCSSLTSFPLIDTSLGQNFLNTWQQCTGLTSFPLIDTSSGSNFTSTWYLCSGLTSFPLIDTSSGTDFTQTWYLCSGLTSFPLIDTSSGSNFTSTWRLCTGLTSFPLIDTSLGTNFTQTWRNCTGLTSFPALNLLAGTSFATTWQNCTSLTTFPANMFDTVTATNFTNAFLSTALTEASIDNILVSIDTAGTSNGTFNQSGGTAPSVGTGRPAIDNLRGRGWTVTVTGGY